MKLSAIVPVYNVEKYLEECLLSLTEQTDSFDEVILINDGSTDRSKEICEKYCRHYSYFNLVNQVNRGLAAARNIGVRKTTADYVIFVDSDDYLRKESCAVIRKALRERRAEVLYYNADVQYDIPSSEKRDAFKHIDMIDICRMEGMEYLETVFPTSYTASSCVAAYSRSFLKRNSITFPEGIYFEDNFFSLQVISCARYITGIKDSLYVRRCRENSIMTSKLTEKKCKDLVISQKTMWKYLADHPKWSGYIELKIRFISFGILHTFFEISHYHDDVLKIRLKQNMIELFFYLHFSEFNKKYELWEVNITLLIMMKELSYKIDENKNLIQEYYGSERQLNSELQRVEKRVKEQIAEKMLLLPFDKEDCKVGVYGIGKHTEILLDLYQKEIGKIYSNLFFVITNQIREQRYLDREVLTYKELPDDTDYVVISSYVYQQEMYRNLLEQKIEKKRIFSLYTDSSICDLIMVKWIMEY